MRCAAVGMLLVAANHDCRLAWLRRDGLGRELMALEKVVANRAAPRLCRGAGLLLLGFASGTRGKQRWSVVRECTGAKL